MIFYTERFSTWLFVLKMIWKSVKTTFMIRKIAISVNYPAIFRNSVAKFSRYSEVPESNQPLLVSRLVKDPFSQCCSSFMSKIKLGTQQIFGAKLLKWVENLSKKVDRIFQQLISFKKLISFNAFSTGYFLKDIRLPCNF